MSGRTSVQRSPGRIAVALVLGALAQLSAAGPGRAECLPDPDDATVIECAANDDDGFDAGASNDLDLTVLQGVTVGNAPDMDTLRLNDDSSITIEAGGTVVNDAADGVAASVGDRSAVLHAGDIEISGDGGVGISGGSNDSVDGLETLTGSFIQLQAQDNIGIRALDDTVVTHGGSIDAGSSPGAVGIQIGSTSNDSAHVHSVSGTIQLEGDGSTGVELGSGNTFVNAGTISVTGLNGVGVLAGADGGEGNTIQNNGLIAVNDSGIAVNFEFSGSGEPNSLDNQPGARIDAGTGVAVLGSAAIEFLISDGEITGSVDLAAGNDSVDLRPGGILTGDVNLGAHNDSIVMEGATLTGDVDLGDGRDTFALLAGSTVTGTVNLGVGNDSFAWFEGGVVTTAGGDPGMIDGGDGTDRLVLAGSVLGPATVDLSAIADFEILALTGGDWTFRNDASFGEGITLSGGIARMDGPVSFMEGDLTAATASTLEVSDTLTLADGDYTQADGATLRAVLDPGGPSGSVVATTGAATLDAGAQLEIESVAPLGDGEIYPILSATGGITGDFSGLPAPTAVLSFDVMKVNMNREIVLEVQRLPYASAASTANQGAVATALDGVLGAGPTGDMLDLLAALDQTPVDAYGAALDALQPEVYDAQTGTSLWLGQSFARLAARNLVECEPAYYEHVPDWIARGRPCGEERWTPWLGTFGNLRQRDGGGGHIDYDAQTVGIAMGAGRMIGESWDVSGWVGTGLGWLDVDGAGDGDLQTIELGVAGARRLGGAYVRSAVGYGHGWHRQDRGVAIDGYVRNATGEFSSDRVTGLLEIAYDLQEEETISLSPVASVDFTWLTEEGFTESGGQGANLSLGDRSQTLLGTTLGVQLTGSFVKHRYVIESIQWANGLWRPEIDLRWRSNWTGVDRDIEGRFVGAPAGTGFFTARGEDVEQGAEVTIGTTFQPYGTQALVTAGYRGFIGFGAQSHGLNLDIRIPF